MSSPIKLRERSNRPLYSFEKSDKEDPIIFPRKHGKSTAKDVKIDGYCKLLLHLVLALLI